MRVRAILPWSDLGFIRAYEAFLWHYQHGGRCNYLLGLTQFRQKPSLAFERKMLRKHDERRCGCAWLRPLAAVMTSDATTRKRVASLVEGARRVPSYKHEGRDPDDRDERDHERIFDQGLSAIVGDHSGKTTR